MLYLDLGIGRLFIQVDSHFSVKVQRHLVFFLIFFVIRRTCPQAIILVRSRVIL